MLLDVRHSAGDAWIVRGKKADQRNYKCAGIRELRVIRLRECVLPRVVCLFTDLGVDALARRAPAVERSVEVEPLRALDRSVECHPGHDFRVCEMLRPTARLPDALIGLLPDRLQPLQ